MEIADMDGVVDDVIGKVVGLPMAHAALDAAAGHPDAEVFRVMVDSLGLGKKYN